MAQQTTDKPQRQSERTETGLAPRTWSDPFAFVRRFADEMERVFEGFTGPRGLQRFPFWTEAPSREIAWMPQVEVLQREDSFVVRADLPGLKREDIKLEISDNELTLQGERKHEREEKREGYYRSECSYGSFYRRIYLPEGAETDKAKASFKDGVLEVTVPTPKRAEPPNRKLEIQ